MSSAARVTARAIGLAAWRGGALATARGMMYVRCWPPATARTAKHTLHLTTTADGSQLVAPSTRTRALQHPRVPWSP